jgi:hypothetical protein
MVRFEERRALVQSVGWQPDQIEDCRRGVDGAGDAVDLSCPLMAPGARSEWHANIFFVNEQRMREVARVLSEGLSVVAEHDHDRVVLQPQRA